MNDREQSRQETYMSLNRPVTKPTDADYLAQRDSPFRNDNIKQVKIGGIDIRNSMEYDTIH